MSIETEELLDTTLCSTLETMAFMFADRVEKNEVNSVDQKFICATIVFSGKYIGSLQILAPHTTCCILAANMLGMEPQDKECTEKAHDAFREALNVVCGQFLTNAFGQREVFTLSTPEVSECPINVVEDIIARDDSVCFSVEDELFVMNLSYQQTEG